MQTPPPQSTGGGQTVSSKLNQLLNGNIQLQSTNIDHGDIIDSGQCGDNAYYTFYSDGLLEVGGTGEMYDKKLPCDDYFRAKQPYITSIKILNGITHVGKYSFYNGYYVTKIIIPDSVVSIGDNAFSTWGASFNSVTELYLGSGIQSIGKDAFACMGREFRNITLNVYINLKEEQCNFTPITTDEGKPIVYHYLAHDLSSDSVDLRINTTNIANTLYNNNERKVSILSVILNTPLEDIPLTYN